MTFTEPSARDGSRGRRARSEARVSHSSRRRAEPSRDGRAGRSRSPAAAGRLDSGTARRAASTAPAPAVEGRWRRGCCRRSRRERRCRRRRRSCACARMNGRELAGARVAFTAAPDRLHVGRDRHQLGEVVLQVAVVVGRIEQAFAIGSAIGIGEDGEAREMDPPAARELDARDCRPARSSRLPRMSSPIGRRMARRASSSPRRIGASTVSVRGIAEPDLAEQDSTRTGSGTIGRILMQFLPTLQRLTPESAPRRDSCIRDSHGRTERRRRGPGRPLRRREAGERHPAGLRRRRRAVRRVLPHPAGVRASRHHGHHARQRGHRPALERRRALRRRRRGHERSRRDAGGRRRRCCTSWPSGSSSRHPLAAAQRRRTRTSRPIWCRFASS